MEIGRAATALALAAIMTVAAPGAAQESRPWYKQPWNPANVQKCDRDCLVRIGEAYLRALQSKDAGAVPFAEQVIATENTGRISMGTGLFWRARIEQTPFKVVVADPVQGQVALQSVLEIDGAPALTAIRLRVERNMITEVEHLYDRDVAPEAMELLQRPVPLLLSDVPEDRQLPREYLTYAAESYFDALTGEDGRIAPFAEDCNRHEQGYRTVNHPAPSRASPTPRLPDPETELGRFFLKLSTMTCAEQIDTGVFAGMKRIWPHRVLVVDQQKGLVATFPFFVHDGRRHAEWGLGPNAIERPQTGAGMVTNLTMMETFAIRDGKIHHVEAFPFVRIPYGRNDGWTSAEPH